MLQNVLEPKLLLFRPELAHDAWMERKANPELQTQIERNLTGDRIHTDSPADDDFSVMSKPR
jgi:hypothetical protein